MIHSQALRAATLPPPALRSTEPCLTPSRHLQVAHEALRGIAIRQARRAETGTVWIHSPTQGRVAGQAVPLGMTRGTALEPLARRPPVLQQPLRLRVMEGGVQASRCRQADFTMTAPAEQLRVVARRALGLAAVRIRGVALDEVRDMEATASTARVAVRAEALLVAPCAGRCSGGGRNPVFRAE